MKFPVATTALVSAALVFVVWQQAREESGQPDAGSFQNMSSKPVERGEVVDWVASQVPALCTEQPDLVREVRNMIPVLK